MKNIIYALLLIALVSQLALADIEPNETESYFFSPHGLGRTAEVDEALNKITSQIRVKSTTYNLSAISYVLSNIVIDTDYNDGKQNITIPTNSLVTVTGGRVQFTYKFNYTKIEGRNNFTGYAYGSVLSDPLTYSKGFGFADGFLCWVSKGVQNLTVNNTMKLKRMDPFNQTDASNIENMLNNATIGIDPVNIKSQILLTFNQIFPLALNQSLNHEILGQRVNYTFNSARGQLKMNIVHQVYGFGIDPQEGFFRYFLTIIDGYQEPQCNISVPKTHWNFDVYGGSQNFFSTCFYQYVVGYLQSNGWLDTVLNQEWQTNAFQFYAGDLFDLISNLQVNFSPRSILDGSCTAQKEGLRLISARQFDSNSYSLDVTYVCNLKGSNKDRVETPILKFTSKNKFYIQAGVTTKTLTFKIIGAEIVNLSFTPVGNYYVNNVNLALWKANQAMKTLVNTFTFGTNFPTITRQLPKVVVSADFVLYYDPSHTNSQTALDF